MNMYDVIILTDRKALVAAVFSELYQNYDLNYDMNKTGMELHKSIINRTINTLLDKCAITVPIIAAMGIGSQLAVMLFLTLRF